MYSNRPVPVHISAAEHGITPEQISHHALTVLQRLHEQGYGAYLVGGCVRDALVGQLPKDFDVVTDARPEQVRALFRHARIIGRRFRIVHVIFGHEVIEVTTFRGGDDDAVRRSDQGRILRDNVFGTLEEDVWRRDFACNALYYDFATAEIIDFVQGWQDVSAGRLRLIGNPQTRYQEDPVRMLRAARFAAKLGFKLTEDTAAAIHPCRHLLKDIAPARLFDESIKLFQGGYGWSAFEQLRALDLFGFLFAGLDELLNRDYVRIAALLKQILQGTDERVAAQLPVNPAFLFAGMLWPDLTRRREYWLHQRVDSETALAVAADEVIDSAVRQVAIPRRLTDLMRVLWALQPQLERWGAIGEPGLPLAQLSADHKHLLAHAWFRAGLDFLCLRAAVGEVSESICAFWRQYAPAREAQGGELIPTHLPEDFASHGSLPDRPRRSRHRRPRRA
ncbi:polynucleotide adenylyltransferase PcnB [Halothiobacillus sp. DCM-1]|uniref:polynucleotide adenylyltransferase PcnB n=1 Tax=Halothiobacillus sp. DCM-1 TaxID=3112558 RepID=UPI0032565444